MHEDKNISKDIKLLPVLLLNNDWWLQKFIASFKIEVLVIGKLFELLLKQSKLYNSDFKSNIELMLYKQHRQSFLVSG